MSVTLASSNSTLTPLMSCWIVSSFGAPRAGVPVGSRSSGRLLRSARETVPVQVLARRVAVACGRTADVAEASTSSSSNVVSPSKLTIAYRTGAVCFVGPAAWSSPSAAVYASSRLDEGTSVPQPLPSCSAGPVARWPPSARASAARSTSARSTMGHREPGDGRRGHRRARPVPGLGAEQVREDVLTHRGDVAVPVRERRQAPGSNAGEPVSLRFSTAAVLRSGVIGSPNWFSRSERSAAADQRLFLLAGPAMLPADVAWTFGPRAQPSRGRAVPSRSRSCAPRRRRPQRQSRGWC